MANCVIRLMQCPGVEEFQIFSAGMQNPIRTTMHMTLTIMDTMVNT